MAPNNNKQKKKNNKKNRNKNKKASGAGENHNHNQNNSTIPTTVATARAAVITTTTSLTTEELDRIDEAYGLTDYPKSTHYDVGVHHLKVEQEDLAIASFIRGAENDGCVGCMFFLLYLQLNELNNVHLVLPWALECSIRGHTESMEIIIHECYNNLPEIAPALSSFWVKLRIELGDTSITEEDRKNAKKTVANMCYVCEKEDTVDKTFEKCGICKYYSYCGKNCQTYHWKEQNHMGECRHLKILHTCCKPHHVKEIREAIINGDDPKEIPRLQNLRSALGLNRPQEEYEELLLRLGDDNDSTIEERYHYLTARKDGTVHIGSTPNVI